MLQNAGVLYILTCKCASRHSGVPFLNIGTSKSGARVWCFAHFDLQMYFVPQRRAIFEHRNFKKWPESVVFCAFWLTHVLLATAACNFCGSKLPKLVRPCGVLCILSWKFALCHSGVPFFEHQNVQNWSEHAVFCAFCLANVLRATAACHFWTWELQKLFRPCGVLCILTWKCASHHSAVPFFICLLEQVPPHPPLWRGYFSNIRKHESLKKHSDSRRP